MHGQQLVHYQWFLVLAPEEENIARIRVRLW